MKADGIISEMNTLTASREKIPGLVIVLVIHGVALYALWHYEVQVLPIGSADIFADFINGAPSAKKEEQPKPKAVLKAPPVPQPPALEPVPEEPPQLAVESPNIAPGEPVAPPVMEAIPDPSLEASPPVSLPMPEPVQLGTELSVTCPGRTAPEYPYFSRLHNEEGEVVVRVELDEEGKISSAVVEKSSGSSKLDFAALSAVKNWRCNPAVRNGIATRAVALQPFLFKLGAQ